MDRYHHFDELAGETVEGRDYTIITRAGVTGIAVMAPHGGRIEPGTDQAAEAVAGREHAFYAFKGTRLRNNAELHITSERFNEPRALEMAARSHTVITIHGCRSPKPMIYVGGLDRALQQQMIAGLRRVGFAAGESPRPGLRGTHPRNLCNLGIRREGVQLEVAGLLRRQWMSGNGRPEPHPTFDQFVEAVRNVLTQHAGPST